MQIHSRLNDDCSRTFRPTVDPYGAVRSPNSSNPTWTSRKKSREMELVGGQDSFSSDVISPADGCTAAVQRLGGVTRSVYWSPLPIDSKHS